MISDQSEVLAWQFSVFPTDAGAPYSGLEASPDGVTWYSYLGIYSSNVPYMNLVFPPVVDGVYYSYWRVAGPTTGLDFGDGIVQPGGGLISQA